MKIIGTDYTTGCSRAENIIVHCTRAEWSTLQDCAGVPYSKQSYLPGAAIDVTLLAEIVKAYKELNDVRSQMAKAQKCWATALNAIDTIMATEKP